MDLRAAKSADLDAIREIDAVIQSTQYLHVDHSGEGMNLSVRIELRNRREKLIAANPLGDELAYAWRQIAGGADEGTALVIEHNSQLLAALLAQPRPELGVVQLLDVRVDWDFRRQGLGQSLVYRLIMAARESGHRAVMAEVAADNVPAAALLHKCGFELSGLDARRRSNHDLVKESATLFWYAALD
jgi:ribosomal protein S18 acetylase RimI-like enzyme